MSIDAKSSKLAIVSWCFFDFANSSFFTVVLTFIFAAYFTGHVAVNTTVGTHQWGNAVALAGLIVALCSPIFGAIADFGGRRKLWLALTSLVAIIACAMLWFVKPDIGSVMIALTSVVLAIVGVEVGMVFYNALLPSLVPKNYLGRVSGWAWGFGYVGGLLALIVALFAFINPPHRYLVEATAQQVRICGPFVAVWFAVFALPLFLFVPDKSLHQYPFRQAIHKGLKQLIDTAKQLRDYKNILLFLVAHMIYADGLATVFIFGGVYAAGTFHMDVHEVILFGITMNVTAGLGAGTFAWLDDAIGPKRTILISLLGLIVLTISVLLVKDVTLFWVLTSILCIFVGPVQAASRSLMARLAPEDKVTEMFGLYAFSGKATAFLGPWLLGWLTLVFDSQRIGLSVVLLFFILGGGLLLNVNSNSSH